MKIAQRDQDRLVGWLPGPGLNLDTPFTLPRSGPEGRPSANREPEEFGPLMRQQGGAPELHIHVHQAGNRVDVRVEGTPQALSQLGDVGPELASSLASGGFTLGDFGAGAQHEQQQSDPEAAPRALAPRVQHGRTGFLIQRTA